MNKMESMVHIQNISFRSPGSVVVIHHRSERQAQCDLRGLWQEIGRSKLSLPSPKDSQRRKAT